MFIKLFSYMNRYLHLSSYACLDNFQLGINIYYEHGVNLVLHLAVVDLYLRAGYNDPQIIEEFNRVSGY